MKAVEAGTCDGVGSDSDCLEVDRQLGSTLLVCADKVIE
jgi:hypothetical protein